MIQKKYALKQDIQGKAVVITYEDSYEHEEESPFQTGSMEDELFLKIRQEIENYASLSNTHSETTIIVESCLITDQHIPVLFVYPEGANELPVVFFNHGTGGDAVGLISMGIPLAYAGFFTVLVDARMHGRRRPANFKEAFYGNDYKKVYLTLLQETTQDISRLIDYLEQDPRADTHKVGISGISQGGYLSFFAITQDKRIKVAAPIIGSPDLEDQYGASPPFDELEPTVQQDIIRFSPLRNYRQMPPVALLVQNGNEDIVVPVEGVRKLEAKLKELYKEMPDRYQYVEYDGVGHAITLNGIEDPLGIGQRMMAWFTKHL
ncbi:prolyl oligopeptidase family serine peptidase [Paenibacillus sp. HWE-109]|uniref:alpha/beta hydrolase family protein n=1 Tax=Paenibacillus sp. HWE-109 TaxID=1306526 RepID=UPI001EDEE4C7|nr:prolyl oligopeptidase family serine peptidase [Paenibacillus sp. HWE-109]UKS25270.1 prolyl oligopeptidase family serine peptidase [Paenibacillus sp. HWE-109]